MNWAIILISVAAVVTILWWLQQGGKGGHK